MRDSVVFYKSFYEAISLLSEEDFTKAVKNILDYAFNEVEPAQKEGVAYALFCMAKPQIDANNQRFENGKKGGEYGKLGGRPRKNPIGVIDENPIGVKEKTPNVNVNVNDNVNVNVNDNVNESNLVNSVIMNTYYPIAKSKSKEDVLKELDSLIESNKR